MRVCVRTLLVSCMAVMLERRLWFAQMMVETPSSLDKRTEIKVCMRMSRNRKKKCKQTSITDKTTTKNKIKKTRKHTALTTQALYLKRDVGVV